MTMDKAYVVVLLLCCLALINGQEYCDLDSCKGREHTMCKYPSATPAGSCGELGVVGLSQEEKDALLKVHNDHRAYVASGQETRGRNGGQPAATNLGPLSWNDEIAEIAQRWANQCEYHLDRCRDVANGPVGQNIAMSMSSGKWFHFPVTQMVDDWYNEVYAFNKDDLASYPLDGRAGHYTQLVWAETTSVGCGAIKYHNSDDVYTTYLVCNYAPTGNFIGRPIYETS